MAASQIGAVGTIWALPLRAAERTPFPVVQTPFLNDRARLSPDGRWIAYNTSESGASQIVVQVFPDVAAGKWQLSAWGGLTSPLPELTDLEYPFHDKTIGHALWPDLLRSSESEFEQGVRPPERRRQRG